MHLSGDSDGVDALARLLRAQIPDCGPSRFPPRFGILLRPPRLWRSEIEWSRRGSFDITARAHENAFDAARPDIEAEEQSTHSEQQFHGELIEPLIRVAALAECREIEALFAQIGE